MKIPITLSLCLLVSGCAVFNKFDYRSAEVKAPKPPGTQSIAVGSLDQRTLILSGRSPTNYVGMTRGGFGNPFSVLTKSKAPFSTDVSEAVAAGLSHGGWPAKSVVNFQSKNTASALAELKGTSAKRWILITIREWESDTLISTELAADVTLAILDSNGKILAEASYKGTKNLGADAFNPIIHARASVLAEFSRIFSHLLADPKIAQALR